MPKIFWANSLDNYNTKYYSMRCIPLIMGDKNENFQDKTFCAVGKKEQIMDKLLHNAIVEVSNGLIDADLGGGLIKKRVAKKGKESVAAIEFSLPLAIKIEPYLFLDLRKVIAKI